VDANTLAGTYQSENGSYRPIIPLSPTRPIALDIAGKAIHRHTKSSVWDAAHAGPLLHRILLRIAWALHVLVTIDWDAHRLSTNVHRRHRGYFVKLCHGYLPAGKIAHRNNPSFPDYCPLCKQPAEDHQHILQCPDPSRKAWQKKASRPPLQQVRHI
jgi:hypothetical protein